MPGTLAHCTDPAGVQFTPALTTVLAGVPQDITVELCVPVVPTGTSTSYLRVLLESKTPRLRLSTNKLVWDGTDSWPPPTRQFRARVYEAPDPVDDALTARIESSMVEYDGKVAHVHINAATNERPPPNPPPPPSGPPPPSKPSPPSKPPSPPVPIRRRSRRALRASGAAASSGPAPFHRQVRRRLACRRRRRRRASSLPGSRFMFGLPVFAMRDRRGLVVRAVLGRQGNRGPEDHRGTPVEQYDHADWRDKALYLQKAFEEAEKEAENERLRRL